MFLPPAHHSFSEKVNCNQSILTPLQVSRCLAHLLHAGPRDAAAMELFHDSNCGMTSLPVCLKHTQSHHSLAHFQTHGMSEIVGSTQMVEVHAGICICCGFSLLIVQIASRCDFEI